jgi:hypothetical protein
MDINGPQPRLENQPPASEEDTLAAAIERLEAGAPLAEVLAAYPADEAWLAPLLSMVAGTKQLQQMIPAPDPAMHLNTFLGQAQQLGAGASGSFWLRRFGRENPIFLAIAAFALVIVLLLLCTTGQQIFGLPGFIALPPAVVTITETSPATSPATPTATDTLTNTPPATETATPASTATQSGQSTAPLTSTLTITPGGASTLVLTATVAAAQTPSLTSTQAAESGELATTPTSAADASPIGAAGQVTATAQITATGSVQTETQTTPASEAIPPTDDAAGGQAATPTPPASPPTQPGDPSDPPPEFLPVSGDIGSDSWLVLGLGLIGLVVGLILHSVANRRE